MCGKFLYERYRRSGSSSQSKRKGGARGRSQKAKWEGIAMESLFVTLFTLQKRPKSAKPIPQSRIEVGAGGGGFLGTAIHFT